MEWWQLFDLKYKNTIRALFDKNIIRLYYFTIQNPFSYIFAFVSSFVTAVSSFPAWSFVPLAAHCASPLFFKFYFSHFLFSGTLKLCWGWWVPILLCYRCFFFVVKLLCKIFLPSFKLDVYWIRKTCLKLSPFRVCCKLLASSLR